MKKYHDPFEDPLLDPEDDPSSEELDEYSPLSDLFDDPESLYED